MKKLLAFVTAFVIFAVAVTGCHFYAKERVSVNNPAFSFWADDGKFGARSAILENLNDSTIVAFGSSEFQHGRKTPYFPANVFRDSSLQMMLIGAGYYQSLSHAITLASIGNDLKTKQVVLFVAPQWFRKAGVQPQAFASRFSETHYIGMLKNNRLNDKTKQYIIERTKSLLQVDPPAQKRTDLYERVLYSHKASLIDRVNYGIYSRFLKEKELQNIAFLLDQNRIYKKSDSITDSKTPDFSALLENAAKDGEKENSQNEFFMDQNVFQKQIRPSMKKKKDQSLNGSYSTSPEYKDLECFLDICKQLGIKPLLVELPVNGYWYDYTGFPKEQRLDYYSKIRMTAQKYGADLADFSDQEYTKYFFEDGIHIGKKGWVMVNESIYRFYQKNKADKTL